MRSGFTNCSNSKAIRAATSSSVIIATVVPRALHNLEVLAAKYFHADPLVAGQGKAAWPMPLDVDEPQNVGADRALNVIAAHARHPGDLIVIDFGTATTFDVVDAAGAYKGGIIAPGINLSLDALVNATAKLPRIAIEAPSGDLSVIGRTTQSQMTIGIYWGYVAMIEGLTRAHCKRAWPARHGHCDRGARRIVRQAHRRLRRDRARPHHPGLEFAHEIATSKAK